MRDADFSRIPHQETEKTFRFPMGFSDVRNLKFGVEPASVGEYTAQGLVGAEPGKYCVNNGTIAAIDSRGEVGVWIPKSDPNAPRTVSFEQAIQSLEEQGFEKGSFYVPFSN